MDILFLDDNPVRLKMFRSAVPSAKMVTTASECIEALKEKWDWVFLDHDIGGEIYASANRADTGMEVVRHIFDNRPEIGHIVVHSHNVPAAKLMVSLLEDAQYDVTKSPFSFKSHEIIAEEYIG